MKINPFAAPACKMSGLKDARKQCIFRSYGSSTFNVIRFDENPFICLCEKEDKKAEGFQIWHFYWSFSNDILAVKGLSYESDWLTYRTSIGEQWMCVCVCECVCVYCVCVCV